MNKLFTLLTVLTIVILSSCSTIYKSGQTPDDVYYSPVRLQDADREDNERRRDRRDRADFNERQIRMGINNPRWRNFDNDFAYNPWFYGFNSGYYFNPFYCPLPVYNPFTPVRPVTPATVNAIRSTNLNAYNNSNSFVNTNVVTNPKTGAIIRTPVRTYNNNGSGLGNTFRRIFNNTNDNSGNGNLNNNNSNRTYSPSSSSGSSRSSSSGGSGVSRPARSGRN